METLMWYLAKVNAIFSILFMAYFFLFKNEKAFYLNRAFLLSSLLLSLLLPVTPAIHFASVGVFPNNGAGVNPLKNVLNAGPAIKSTSLSAADTTAHGFWATTFSHITAIQLLMDIYWIVALVLLTRIIYQLFSLYFLFKRGKSNKRGAIIYCWHDEKLLPFSFFNILFMNPGSNYHQLEQIIEHEKVHIRQWHSVDILLTEVFSILIWINPLNVLFKRYNRLNLEYIADQEVLNTGADEKQYQLSILQNSINPNNYPLTNLFSSSKIKLRIKMINQSRPTRKLYKYLFVLPLVLISYLLVNPVTATPVKIKLIPPVAETPLAAFEGIYRNHIAPTAYFKVSVVNDALVVDRLDFKQQFVLNRTSELAFEGHVTGTGKKMNVVFSKNNTDVISQLSIDKRTQWIKVSAYKVVDQVKLPPAMLKKFDGEYQLERDPGTFLTITSNGTGLMLKQKWDGQERGPFMPTSYLDFLLMDNVMPLRFTKGSNGKIVKMYASGTDVWKKL